MENKCKKECKTYKKWIKGINTSLSPFAVDIGITLFIKKAEKHF